MNSVRRQVATYGAVGAVATALHYLVLIMLAEVLEVHPVPASAVGFAASALLNYSMNRQLTFGGTAEHRRALPRFIAIALSGLVINSLIMAIFYDVVGFHYLLAQIIATAIVFFWTFMGNRLWSFR